MAKIEKSATSSFDNLVVVKMGSLGISSPFGPTNRIRSQLQEGSKVQSDTTDVGGKTSDTAISYRGSSAVDYPSILNADDLKTLRWTYLIPSSNRMLVPDASVRIFDDLGPNRILVYEEILKAGVRFPLFSFYIHFLKRFNLTLSQLNPNN